MSDGERCRDVNSTGVQPADGSQLRHIFGTNEDHRGAETERFEKRSGRSFRRNLRPVALPTVTA